MKPFVLFLAFFGSFSAPQSGVQAQAERFRPQFHFTPERNWMNDPNGLVFYEGEWHLFYQHNPYGDKWGHMSWGHAVSRDLVHWEHLPLALAEDDGIMIFSGSAVVDWKNTSGFGRNGKPPLVAIYTGHREGRQDQRIAFSNDRGRTWTKVPGPVLDLHMADFRDPRVFWHDATSRWVMAVALPNEKKVNFYTSPDLRQWKYAGEFGPAGATGGQWECPDLFTLPVEGGGRKWVLIVNINPGGPVGGSGTQYFTGKFDGKRFVADAGVKDIRWADYGPDFYAAVSWNDVPKSDGRRVWIGWMSNWLYGQDVPTSPWRSAMTVPRELMLRRTPDGLRLVQKPVTELKKLRPPSPLRFGGGTFAAAARWLAAHNDLSPQLDVEMSFSDVTGKAPFSVHLQTAPSESTSLAFDPARNRLVLDRTQSGQTGFHRDFSGRYDAPLRISNGDVRIRFLLDASSIEVLAQGGETSITALIFPAAGSRGLTLASDGATPYVSGITIHALTALTQPSN
jgi:Beta-fructosidases (levanase/invertase)